MISITMMKGSEIVGFGSLNIPKNFDKIIADNKDLAECTSRIDCEIILSICDISYVTYDMSVSWSEIGRTEK